LLWLATRNLQFGLGLPNHLKARNINRATNNIPPIISPIMAQGTATAPGVGVGIGVGIGVGVGFAVCVVAGVALGVTPGVGVGVVVVMGDCISPP
jgi:hypothetical protein